MIICKNCGVELDSGMQYCPLCQMHIEGENADVMVTSSRIEERATITNRNMTQPQRKATWEIVSIIILLVVMFTSLLNFILNRKISWAEIPMAACLVIFSYVSVFAFLHKKRVIQIFYVFVMSSILIFILDLITGGVNWSIYLGIPLLFFLNFILALTQIVFKNIKKRGINLIAFAFLAASLLCLGTEVVIDFYINGIIKLVWSLIVVGCVGPIVTVLLFMHFRLKKGNDLNRIFHT